MKNDRFSSQCGSVSALLYYPDTKEELQNAVNLWCENQETATEKYGDINSWNVSKITDMSRLFYKKEHFNSDISNWDVSNVTDMSDMFGFALSFNQNIGSWNVRNVKHMSGIRYRYQ